MRKNFTILALFIAPAVSAQLNKGDWNINASTNALMNLKLRTNGAGYKTYDFGFNPGVGYFIANRWEIGGGPVLSISGNKYKDLGTGQINKNNYTSAGLNLYTRYYLKSEDRVIPYFTLNATYLNTQGTSVYNNVKSSFRMNQWQVGAGGGVSWFISPRVALFSELNYTGNWGTGNGYTSGLDLKVGFQFFLNRKKAKNK